MNPVNKSLNRLKLFLKRNKEDIRLLLEIVGIFLVVCALWESVRANRLTRQAILAGSVPWLAINLNDINVYQGKDNNEIVIEAMVENYSDTPALEAYGVLELDNFVALKIESAPMFAVMPHIKQRVTQSVYVNSRDTILKDLREGNRSFGFAIEWKDIYKRKYKITQYFKMESNGSIYSTKFNADYQHEAL